MQRSNKSIALVLLCVSLGCTKNSMPLPNANESSPKQIGNADILGGRNKSERFELRDEIMLEKNRFHQLDEAGQLVEANIVMKDGAKITCNYQAGKLKSAEEIRNDGARIVYTMTDDNTGFPILREELYRFGGLKVRREASPNDQGAVSATMNGTTYTSFTQNPNSYSSTYFAGDGKSIICTDVQEAGSNGSVSLQSYYDAGTTNIFATIKYTGSEQAETTIFRNGKLRATQRIDMGLPLGIEIIVSAFREDGTLHYTQKWSEYKFFEMVEHGGQLILAEEYATDGKTVIRRISDIPDKVVDYSNVGETNCFKSVTLNAAGKELSARYLRANGTVIQEDFYGENGQIKNTVTHGDSEQVKEVSESLVLTDYKSCPELLKVKELIPQIGSMAGDLDNNHRRNVLCK